MKWCYLFEGLQKKLSAIDLYPLQKDIQNINSEVKSQQNFLDGMELNLTKKVKILVLITWFIYPFSELKQKLTDTAESKQFLFHYNKIFLVKWEFLY